MRITNLFNRFFQRREFYYQLIKENEDYMKSGKYRLTLIPYIDAINNTSGKMAWKKIDNNTKWIKLISKCNIKMMLRLLLYKNSITIIKDGKKGNGEELLISREEDIKIFDYTNKNIITKLSNSQKYNKLQYANNIFKDYYANNHAYVFFDNDLSFSERYIEYERLWFHEEKAGDNFWKWIVNKYSQYVKENRNMIEKKEIQKIFIQYTNISKTTNVYKLISRWKKITETIQKEDIYYIYSHRDLVLENVIPYKDDFIIIDYEDAGNDIFFFDLFFWFVGRSIFGGNYMYLEKYLNGFYDTDLTNIFNLFDNHYNSCLRKQYLALFLTSLIGRYIEGENRDISITLYNSIEGIMHRMESF